MAETAFISKVTSQRRCPVCGDDLAATQETPAGALFPIADVRFVCGARFWADARSIISAAPCRSGSLLAAKLMCIEAEGRIR
ncbi:hypothetical protein [Rhizobium sp. BT04]|uniref:hypothetical protein n=1 Tax=Rhizobium sp. BT04 TaxID=3045157 RepID=UPI0024B3D285|nr:hypothetical protein [Rhizobium sp. BT04]